MWRRATDVSNAIAQAWNVKERQRKVAGAVSRNGLKLQGTWYLNWVLAMSRISADEGGRGRA